MKLRDYLFKHGVSQGEFGKLIGVSQGEVSRLCRGNRNPTIQLAAKIASATSGEVIVSDFLPADTLQVEAMPVTGAFAVPWRPNRLKINLYGYSRPWVFSLPIDVARELIAQMEHAAAQMRPHIPVE